MDDGNLSPFHFTHNFFLIAGPCVVEDEETTWQIAQHVSSLCRKHEIPYIFKASYRKANRSSLNSFTGIGDIKALEIISTIGKELNVATATDIHTAEEAELAAKYVDVLQIPAFLCRQTDLLIAAAKTGKLINIKKGQFMSAEAMRYAAEKVYETGNPNVFITERGTTFGYNDLIVDFRNIPIIRNMEIPAVVDITHSLQQPNQSNGVTGGKPEMIETIAKAAIACGADGIFLETHPNPSEAKSDGANMLKMELLDDLLVKLLKIREAVI